MKRFLLFHWEIYEACGGWGDFAGSAGTKAAALRMLPGKSHLYEVVDTKTGKIVAEGREGDAANAPVR